MEHELSNAKDLCAADWHPQNSEEWLENAIADGSLQPPPGGCGVTIFDMERRQQNA